MLSTSPKPHTLRVMAQAEVPPSVLFAELEMDLWLYRARTIAMVRRYAQASIEVGRLPSLLGREFFRTRVTSYSSGSFEDIVIFVTDMERTLEQLTAIEKKLLAMYLIEEYTMSEMSRLLSCCERTVERLLHDAVDQLSQMLLARRLLQRLPEPPREVSEGVELGRSDLDLEEDGQFLDLQKSCQEGKCGQNDLSYSNENENKSRKRVGLPPSNLIS